MPGVESIELISVKPGPSSPGSAARSHILKWTFEHRFYSNPLSDLQELLYSRKDAIQSGIDRSKIRLCHENKDIETAYREFFGKPLGEKAEALLHCR